MSLLIFVLYERNKTHKTFIPFYMKYDEEVNAQRQAHQLSVTSDMENGE